MWRRAPRQTHWPRALALSLCLLPACTFLPGGDGSLLTEVEPLPPVLQEASLSCDLDDGQWTLSALAEGWTSGGLLYLTLDGDYIEKHTVQSVKADANGTWDELEAKLKIASDWREVTLGASTALHCLPDPDGMFFLLDADGHRTGCWKSGPDPQRWGTIDGTPDCTPD